MLHSRQPDPFLHCISQEIVVGFRIITCLKTVVGCKQGCALYDIFCSYDNPSKNPISLMKVNFLRTITKLR